MPRRPTPLNPDDGPQARFAIALRRLRDEAGFDAKRIDSIAAETGIARATLFAAMRGQRIPTVPVLAALVTAWNGDPVWWLEFRTSTEKEIEQLRLERKATSAEVVPSPGTTRDGREHDRLASGPDRDLSVDSPAELIRQLRAAEEALGQHRSMLLQRQASARIPDSADLFLSDVQDHLRSSRALSTTDGDHMYGAWQAKTVAEKMLNELPYEEAVERLASGLDTEYVWAQLRNLAGAPTVRELANATGMTQDQVSRALRGRPLPTDRAEVLFHYMVNRAAAIRARSQERVD